MQGKGNINLEQIGFQIGDRFIFISHQAASRWQSYIACKNAPQKSNHNLDKPTDGMIIYTYQKNVKEVRKYGKK